MPELEPPTRTRDEPIEGTEHTDSTDPIDSTGPGDRPASTGTGPRFEVDGTSVTVSGEPTEAEAAVVAAVVTEHLRAEADAAEAGDEPRYAVDPWCLSGRLGIRTPRAVPNTCPSGREWKVAGRAATW